MNLIFLVVFKVYTTSLLLSFSLYKKKIVRFLLLLGTQICLNQQGLEYFLFVERLLFRVLFVSFAEIYKPTH